MGSADKSAEQQHESVDPEPLDAAIWEAMNPIERVILSHALASESRARREAYLGVVRRLIDSGLTLLEVDEVLAAEFQQDDTERQHSSHASSVGDAHSVLPRENACSYAAIMTISTGELVALQRSAAMLTPGQTMPVARETVQQLCGEVLEARALLARLGADLKAVARRAD